MIQSSDWGRVTCNGRIHYRQKNSMLQVHRASIQMVCVRLIGSMHPECPPLRPVHPGRLQCLGAIGLHLVHLVPPNTLLPVLTTQHTCHGLIPSTLTPPLVCPMPAPFGGSYYRPHPAGIYCGHLPWSASFRRPLRALTLFRTLPAPFCNGGLCTKTHPKIVNASKTQSRSKDPNPDKDNSKQNQAVKLNIIKLGSFTITLAGIACIIMREGYATIGEKIYPNPTFLSRDFPEASGRLLRNHKELPLQHIAN